MPTFERIADVLKHYTVGIAGAGGLGSNVAMALTRIGIGKLVIADFDVVSESNLNRQFYFHDQIGHKKVQVLKENLLRINSKIDVEIHDIKLNKNNILKVFSGVDVMVEAFDKADMKEMIIEIFQSEKPQIPLVVGNGMAGWGNSNTLNVQQFGNLYVCGDNHSEIDDELPPIAPRVGICAFMQANVVATILLNKNLNTNINP